ncbi:MAG: iron ABC transporter permease [Rhizobiaceae bacterium]
MKLALSEIPATQRNRTGRASVLGLTAAAAFAVLLAIPVLSLIMLAAGKSDGVWPHLIENVLPRSILTTVELLAGVGFLSTAIGLPAAWIVSRYSFPGRNLVHWALVMPLAIPTYVSAYCFVELLDFTGPVQSLLRSVAGFQSARDYWFPDIRSLPGAIFVMASVLYPYVYLTSRLVFEMQGASVIDTARVLGAGNFRVFWRIALPLARPAIIAGSALAMMEALNDIGAVEILGVRTLTFSIFDTWLNRSSLAGAAQISLIMMIFVAALLAIERTAQGRKRYHSRDSGTARASQVRLKGVAAIAALVACLMPPLAGFATPVLLMASFAAKRIEQLGDPALFSAAGNSVLVSALTALLAVSLIFVVATFARHGRTVVAKIIMRLASLGYALPGSILAIGALIAFTSFDNQLDGLLRQRLGISSGLLISGSAAIVVYACTIRFLAIALGAIEPGYSRLSLHLPMAARTLGQSRLGALFKVELPLMKGALATAALLVFVETMKELSATVLLRPFNFQTLATFVYERASRALFEDSAIAALVIVAIGIIPVVLLSRMQLEPSQKKAG